MQKLIRTLWITGALVLIDVPAAATEAPIEGIYRHEGWCAENLGSGVADVDKWTVCKKMPINSLRITQLESEEYAISIEFTAFASTPSHCRFSAIFDRFKEKLSLAEGYAPLECKLTIQITPTLFILGDPQQTCRPAFCWGYNAGFDDVRFPRWNKPNRTPSALDLEFGRPIKR